MKIGSKVLCIDDKNIDSRIPNKPVYFKAYIIRDIVNHVLVPGKGKGVLLEEIHNEPVGLIFKHEPTFSINRFIEVEDKPDMAVKSVTELMVSQGFAAF